MKRMSERVVSVLLALLLALSALPAPALAEMAEEGMGEEPVATAQKETEEGHATPSAKETEEGHATPSAKDPDSAEGEMGEAPVSITTEGDGLTSEETPTVDAEMVEEAQTEEAALSLQDDDGMGGELELTTQSANVSNPRIVSSSGKVVTWDCVWLGSYPQTEVAETTTLRNASWSSDDATVGGVRYRRISRNDAVDKADWGSTSGYRYFRYEPIKWRILKVSGNTALAVADVALDCRQYHKYDSSVTWATSTVRSWLNGTGSAPYFSYGAQTGRNAQGFSTVAFTAEQLGAVRQSSISNANNIKYGTSGGGTTTDRVFLLSESEVYGSTATAYGFASDPDTYDAARRCVPTDYACAMGAFTDDGGPYDGYCYWWLRSPGGGGSQYAVHVSDRGQVLQYGYNCPIGNIAVRPALQLDLSSSHVTYAGTVSSNGAVSEVGSTYRDGVDWSPVYDPDYYAAQNPDVANWARSAGGSYSENLLRHFVSSGAREGRRSKSSFDLASYFNANADLRAAFGGTADLSRYYRHYATNGYREGRSCSGVGSLQGSVVSRDGVDWSPVYDRAYYAQQNGDVKNWATRSFNSGSVVDDFALLQHFVSSGAREGRRSKAGFDLASYFNANADLRAAFGGTADLSKYYRHYATNGYREGRTCSGVGSLQGSVTSRDGVNWSPVYDRAYYAQQNGDVARWATRKIGAFGSVVDDYALLQHFVSNGAREGRRSKAGFDLASYFNANADLRAAFGGTADLSRYYRHYATNGQREGRRCSGVGSLQGSVVSRDGVNWSPVYDRAYYAQHHADVARWATRKIGAFGSVLDEFALLQHFVGNGQRERRQAKSTFNVVNYRNRYADLNRAFGDNWPSYYRHFATNGYRENRNGT